MYIVIGQKQTIIHARKKQISKEAEVEMIRVIAYRPRTVWVSYLSPCVIMSASIFKGCCFAWQTMGVLETAEHNTRCQLTLKSPLTHESAKQCAQHLASDSAQYCQPIVCRGAAITVPILKGTLTFMLAPTEELGPYHPIAVFLIQSLFRSHTYNLQPLFIIPSY